jgi:hypothetical protein
MIDFFGRPTERHGKCEELVKLLATHFYSSPEHYATVEFIALMVKSRLSVLKNTGGYIATIVLETLAPRLGSQLARARIGQNRTDDLTHLKRVLRQLIEILIDFVDNA